MSEITTLYRHFDNNNNLLYIGISNNPIRRLSEHEETKEWKKEISKIEIETFQTRETALIAEEKAIKAEKPKYNIQHNLSIIEVNNITKNNNVEFSKSKFETKDFLYEGWCASWFYECLEDHQMFKNNGALIERYILELIDKKECLFITCTDWEDRKIESGRKIFPFDFDILINSRNFTDYWIDQRWTIIHEDSRYESDPEFPKELSIIRSFFGKVKNSIPASKEKLKEHGWINICEKGKFIWKRNKINV